MRFPIRLSSWLGLGLSLGALLGLPGCRGGDSEKPPVHLIPNMDTQEKGKTYRRDTSGLFEDGRVMRAPVDGTVSVEHLDDDDVYELGIDPDGQPALKFPARVTVDDALVARGENRYGIYCVPCHGPNLDGQGPVAHRGLFVPPPSFMDDRLKGMRHGKIYSAIKNGVNNNNMPSYASQIPTADRWAIIAYIRKMQAVTGNPDGKAVEAPKVAVASLAAGAALYKAKNCYTCHSTDGSRIVGPTFKGIWGTTVSTSAGDVKVDEAYLRESMLQPLAKIVTGYPPAMPPQQLTDAEVKSLILFIKDQK